MDSRLFHHRKNIIKELIYDDSYVPLKLKEIAFLLEVSGQEREELESVLSALVEEGSIVLTARGKYMRPENRNVVGTFLANVKGYGFVRVEESDEDIFIPAEYVNGAFHLDQVKVKVTEEAFGPGQRAQGMIREIVKHGLTQVAGVWHKGDRYGFVVPDDPHIGKDVYVPLKKSMAAEEGDRVVAQLINYGTDNKSPEGRITEILGNIDDPKTDVVSVLKAFGIREDFPRLVLKDASRVSVDPDIMSREESQGGRLDLRDLLTVTIDGEDAKDLDDAITLSREETEEGVRYQLGVHIADVSEYVKEGSALDEEAQERGTSIYFPDRVVPMLPAALSNGICSLNEGEDRLTLSCLMTIDDTGRIIDHTITESVIRVDRRMTYTGVCRILEEEDQASENPGSKSGEEDQTIENPDPNPGGEDQTVENPDPNPGGEDPAGEEQDEIRIRSLCLLMREAASLLKEKRIQRGAIDFDFPESKIHLDEDGFVKEIRPYERNVATDIIEDFMLAANETVAEEYYWQGLPFIYRNHEEPDPARIMKLCTFIRNFGYYMKTGGENFHPKEIQKLIHKLAGEPEEALISRLTLRSMKRASYTTVNQGHFGLSARYYTHFTSPIRRYPDLMIHRIIKENLAGTLDSNRIAHYEEILPGIAALSSDRERRADEVEREVDRIKKAEYMSRHIGETFSAVISGVAAFGFFVELPNTVEGLVPANSLLDDYYLFDEPAYKLIGERSGRVFCLGQRVRVTVLKADKAEKRITFALEEFADQISFSQEYIGRQ